MSSYIIESYAGYSVFNVSTFDEASQIANTWHRGSTYPVAIYYVNSNGDRERISFLAHKPKTNADDLGVM